MSIRGKIRAGIVVFMTVAMISLAFLSSISEIYLKALNGLILPYTIMLGGMYGVDGVKNLKKK